MLKIIIIFIVIIFLFNKKILKESFSNKPNILFIENKKEIKKNLIGDKPANFELHSLKMRPLAKKVYEIRVKNEENLNNQLNELLEIGETTFRVYEDEFLDFTADLNDLKKDKLRLIKDIKKLILFFSDIKNKDEFVNFFKKDICLKNKNIIFIF